MPCPFFPLSFEQTAEQRCLVVFGFRFHDFRSLPCLMLVAWWEYFVPVAYDGPVPDERGTSVCGYSQCQCGQFFAEFFRRTGGGVDRNSSVCPEEPHILRRKRANVSAEKCSNVPLKIISGIPRRSSIGKGVPLTANFICHGKECPVKARLAAHTPIDHARSLISVYPSIRV